MNFGVASDDDFRAKKDGKIVENIYVAGSVLSGFNAIKDGCGAGVSILTALNAADQINVK
jgi:glycerol-3-phosphate dehydrogenase subunit B